MTWAEAAKTGKDFAWGENWRTPNADEVTEEVKKSNEGILFGGLLYDWKNSKSAEGSPSIKIEQKDVNHVEEDIVTFTGVYPGYTKTQLTLYNQIGTDGYSYFDFWTTSESSGYGCKFGITIVENTILAFGIDQRQNKDKKMLVRPVLVK